MHAAPPRRPRSPCRRSRLHALDQPRCCSCPRRRRPASLCCSLSLSAAPSLLHKHLQPAASLAHVACRHLCSARARMREIRWRVAGCGAQSGAPSTALAIMLNRFCTVDEPLSGPERSKLVEEGSVWDVARARRAAPAVARPCQRLGSSEQPLRMSPDRSRRRPGSGLYPYSRLTEKGTKFVRGAPR